MRGWIAILGLCFLVGSVDGQTRKYSNEFLSIGVSAKSLGMGNAQVASVNDVTAGYWNPAGLTRIDPNLQLSLMHSEYFAGIANYDYGGFGVKIDEKNHLALSVIRFGVDDIPNTLELIDETGRVDYSRVKGFSAVDYGFLFSYGRKLNKQLRVGGNFKLVHRKAGPFAQAWGFGLDAGAQFDHEDFTMGLMFRDVTTTFNAWSFSFNEDQKEILTRTGNIIPENSIEITLPKAILGVNHHWGISDNFQLSSEIDFVTTFDGQRNTLVSTGPMSIAPRAGLEFGMWDIAFIRGGIGNFQEETIVKPEENEEVLTFQPNVGVGLQFKVAQLDYAYTDIGDQSIAQYSHVISLRFDVRKGFFGGDDEEE